MTLVFNVLGGFKPDMGRSGQINHCRSFLYYKTATILFQATKTFMNTTRNKKWIALYW